MAGNVCSYRGPVLLGCRHSGMVQDAFLRTFRFAGNCRAGEAGQLGCSVACMLHVHQLRGSLIECPHLHALRTPMCVSCEQAHSS